jgi:hypothetical protein
MRLLLAALLVCATAASADEGDAPHLSGSLKLRLEDGRLSLPSASSAGYLKSLWYGSDIKDATLFEFSAKLEVSGRLGSHVNYGARLMLRNFKTPAFSYPAFESGFGNTAVVADQYYLSFTPIDDLTLSVGKHPMLITRHVNFFWDVDVQPVGASEQYRYALPGTAGAFSHAVGLSLGQWLPLPQLRPAPTAVVLVWQGFYQATFAGEYDLEAAVTATKINGLDRMIASTAIGGAASYSLVTNADGSQSIVSTPKLDFKAENDATLIGYNPLFVDLHLSATRRSVLGRPLSLQVGLLRNVARNTPASVPPTFDGPGLNAVLAGITWGKLKKAWSWQVGYAYTYKGVSSVINGWTDDGFGSDLKGHVFTAELALAEGASVGVTWRLLQDADGRDRAGKPLSDEFLKATISNLRVVVGASF